MKKLTLTFLIIFSIHISFSQGFEGEISWKIQLNTPTSIETSQNTNQEIEKTREDLMKQLSSPEISNNPQLKVMVEKMLTQMPNTNESDKANVMDFMLPKSMIIKIKNGNTLVAVEGAMAGMLGEMLTLKGKTETFAINHSKKSYSILPTNNQKQTNEPPFEVTKTNETLKILNYICTKYKISNTNPKANETRFVYATTQIKDIDLGFIKNLKANDDDKFSAAIAKIDGFPLRMEMISSEMNILMQCTKIEAKELKSIDFILPANYKKIKNFEF